MQNHEEAFSNGASSAQPDVTRPIWNLICQATIPQKMKVMAWKAATSALATFKCMQYRHLRTRATCPLCGVEDESSFHALVACKEAVQLWEGMRRIWLIPSNERLVKYWGGMASQCASKLH